MRSRSHSSEISVWKVSSLSYEAISKWCKVVTSQTDRDLVVEVAEVGVRSQSNSLEILVWKMSS